MTYSEESLIKRAQNGSTDAQKEIYGQHIRYLTAVCSRYILNEEDVKDILQECFIKIFSSLKSFEYRGDGSLRGWMCRIVVNMTLDFMQRKSAIKFTDLTEAEDTCDDEQPEIGDLPDEVIYRLIRELPDGYRAVFNLYVVESKSHKEIAQILKIKESTSASQLHRAKAILAAKIKDYQLKTESAEV